MPFDQSPDGMPARALPKYFWPFSAWVGLRVRGVSGALAAYLGFALPAYAMVPALSILFL